MLFFFSLHSSLQYFFECARSSGQIVCSRAEEGVVTLKAGYYLLCISGSNLTLMAGTQEAGLKNGVIKGPLLSPEVRRKATERD